MPASRPWLVGGSALLLTALLCVSGVAAWRWAAMQPESTTRVGSYLLKKWSDPVPMREAVWIFDRRRKRVARIAGAILDVDPVRNLIGDGTPGVVVSGSGGGAHGRMFYCLFALGSSPRCLLVYDKNNIDDNGYLPDFEWKDLDGDGRKEIVSWYDGFAYWGPEYDACTCYACCARVPVVLGYRGGRYVEVTREYRPWLSRKLKEARAILAGELTKAGHASLHSEGFHAAVQYYAAASLLFGLAEARRMTLDALPARDHPLFLRLYGGIERVLAARDQRYRYPPVYADQPIRSAF